MDQIAEEMTAERIVTHVRNDRSTVRISMGLAQTVWRSFGYRLINGLIDPVPGGIDDGLMSENRICRDPDSKEQGSGRTNATRM